MDSTKSKLKVQVVINAPVELVWEKWTTPASIQQWNNATEEWHTPNVENDLRESGNFLYQMAAKDGSMGFDFSGTYTRVIPYELIEYTLADQRTVSVVFIFERQLAHTILIEIFEAEDMNPLTIQELGWQSILDNFKNYVESSL